MPSPDRAPTWLEQLDMIRTDVAELDRLRDDPHESSRLARGKLLLHLPAKLTRLENAVHDAMKAELAAGTLRGKELIAARDAKDALDAADDAIEAEAPSLLLAEVAELPTTIFGGPEPGEARS